MTLTEFLLARIAEREQAIVKVLRDRPHWRVDPEPWEGGTAVLDEEETAVAFVRGDYAAYHIALNDPAHVLAECKAKRGIVEAAGVTGDRADWTMRQTDQSASDAWEHTLRLLALPYTNHPDYQEAWRP